MMKFVRLPAIALTLLGVLLVVEASALRRARILASVSNAMALEATLNSWVQTKILDAQLTEQDRLEIFNDPYELKLGGESTKQTFREMMHYTADYGGYLRWPGIAAILIGLTGLIRRREPKATSR